MYFILAILGALMFGILILTCLVSVMSDLIAMHNHDESTCTNESSNSDRDSSRARPQLALDDVAEERLHLPPLLR